MSVRLQSFAASRLLYRERRNLSDAIQIGVNYVSML